MRQRNPSNSAQHTPPSEDHLHKHRDPPLERDVSVRGVVREDAPTLGVLEREIFPTVWPSTNFAREIKKANHLYLAAVRPREAVAHPGDRMPSSKGGSGEARGGLFERLLGRFIFSGAGGSTERGQSVNSRDQMVGYAGIWFMSDEAHITAIGVREEERRKGIGELLMLAVLDAARRYGSREVTLEVRKSNEGAQALYRKYGFLEAGLRKRYYVDNQEDAIIMTTPCITSPDFQREVHALWQEHARRWRGHTYSAVSG
ncbi:MAG: ribosomal protein S18-alanine N-acetyltransferase [Chloroflexota bacterium]